MKNSFRGGVHPLHNVGEGKPLTAECAVRRIAPQQVTIPLGMHLGAPSAPCVQVGDTVKIGQVIATPVGGLGIPVHASVSGEVKFVDKRQLLRPAPELCIGIQSDMLDDWVELTPLGDAETAPAERIIECVKNAGICGMGGAAFPTHIKMSIPEGKSADTIVLNGAECEPYLTADHRVMIETPQRVVDGLRLIMRATRVERGVIAIEQNKPDAIAAIQKAAEGREGVTVLALTVKYPQGSEKQLIETVTGRQVPRGKLPVDAHTLVFNVSTAAAIADAVTKGQPLVSRVTTVTGCVGKPDNVLVPIGTAYEEIIASCGGLSEAAAEILAGGPMTAPCASDLSAVVTKANNGILILDSEQARQMEESPCIRCGRCVEACPIGLYPYIIRADIDKHDLEKAKQDGMLDCVLCGACAYICPARRRLTASCKAAKEELVARRKK